LARVEKLAREQDRWIVITEDLENAFDSVPQKRLLQMISMLIPDERMMRLMERLILTRAGRGLRQGGNLSPLLLNLYLHHHLDSRWQRKRPYCPLLRWADDLLVLCKDRDEAEQAYQDLESLLIPTGMLLKGSRSTTIHDLDESNGSIWLGFRLSKDLGGNLKADVTEIAWQHLGEHLELDHEKDSSPLLAIQTILGWIDAMEPCWPQVDVQQAYERIVALAKPLAFDEIPSLEEIRQTWECAYQRWVMLRKRLEADAKGAEAGGSARQVYAKPTTPAGHGANDRHQ
jgi:hypothetical protein